MTNTFPRKTLRAIGLGLSLIAGGLIAAPTAWADPSPRLDRMAEALELRADQRAEVEALFAAHQARMDELGLDPATRREGRRERYALMQEIQALLTSEQREQWAAMREHRQVRGSQRRARQRLMQTLDGMALSEDQRVSIQALIADQRERGREERRSFLDSLETILTPAQFAEIEGLVEQLRSANAARHG